MTHRMSCVLQTGLLLFIGLVVAAIVLPVITPCHHHPARQSRSLNNLKQLAIAVQSYAQDYGETFPGWVKNPDGRFAHNAWDEQIDPYLRSKDVFSTLNERSVGIRSYTDPRKQRVVTYGLNALLICTPSSFTGSAVSTMEANTAGGANAPAPLSSSTVSDPAGTILFAELVTEQPMPGVFGQAPDPVAHIEPKPGDPPASGEPGKAWQKAHDGWIDISPLEFVETTGAGSYDRRTWDASRGVARAMYGGGGNYAFIDGHVKFMKLSQTVGLGQTVTTTRGYPYTVTAANAWRADNVLNQWNPSR